MKLLYFLLPIVLWGSGYFTWPLAGPEDFNGLWWGFTNTLIAFAFIGTLALAIHKNFDV